MSYRICVLVDAPSLVDAYGAVNTAMTLTAKAMRRVGVASWETADNDWFDDAGSEIHEDVIAQARLDFPDDTPEAKARRASMRERMRGKA